ncbi:crotonase/enoyl-CoA hydratase family protein [Nocardia sp. 348MFTsu5.1]|uniref:crotonase/enoyl-CoA hydratase family protein n=1 Tax=Nocardia sp. 348MFTsu5.1 TaxID=1172185 RepID=UPI000377E080|nr:crotonase/enoyl-CoA hydratase family protein [Nocardia sp. 348MFTsu5.1]
MTSESDNVAGIKIVTTQQHGHVQVITINRPEARNSVNKAVAEALGDALEAADADPGVRAIVLTGAGDQAFCAGADLKAISRGEGIMPEGNRAHWGFAGYVSHPVSKPTIAAVNGFALGGGTELALASDLVVAVESATFGLPEVRRGLVAAAGGVFRLPQQIPRKIALELMLTGEPISADRAYDLGLVNRVVPAGQALDAAIDLANTIASNAPLAVQASKRIAGGIADGRVDRDDDDWSRNRNEARRVMASRDAKEGTRAFAQKRSPEWTGE